MLGRIALRIAAVQALKGRTLVGDNVLDSRMTALDVDDDGNARTDEDRPFISLYESGAVEAPKLFADLGDRIHEAVLVHREVIVYANRQFASFVGVDRVELIGRRLADLVPPEYQELVSDNISRRLAGEASAER